MALARLNCGRFNEEAENTGETGNTATTVVGATSTASSGMKTSVVGSSQARFLGEYNPLIDQPLKRRTMNTDVVLLPELSEALEKLRDEQLMHEHHKKKDNLKMYLDEVAKFDLAMKSRK